MTTVVERLKNEGFSRYHASRQTRFDVRIIFMGFTIYTATMVPVYKQNGGSAVLLPLGLGLISFWPAVMQLFDMELYYRWRDIGFILHFGIHHVYAAPALSRLGVDVKEQVSATDHPVLFFLGLLISGSVLWQSLDALMYRIKLRNFILVQPLLLAAIADFDLDICRWAAIHRPEPTERVYAAIVEVFRVVAGSIHPAIGSARQSKRNPVEACEQVQLFAMFFLGYIIPSMLIWRLEKQTWKSFLVTDARLLAWPGGPSVSAIDEALEELRDEERCKVRSEKPGVRLVAVVVIASVFLWKVVELVVGSGVLK